jgi:DNA-binding transcriptional ArsR family regulator
MFCIVSKTNLVIFAPVMMFYIVLHRFSPATEFSYYKDPFRSNQLDISQLAGIYLFTFTITYGIFISTDIEISISAKDGVTMVEDNAEVRQAVKVYKALGEPTRIKIAMLLTEERNLCCSDIGSKLESVAGSTLSHHLKQLTDCGLLNLRKDGTYIYYSVNRTIAQKYAPYLLE